MLTRDEMLMAVAAAENCVFCGVAPSNPEVVLNVCRMLVEVSQHLLAIKQEAAQRKAKAAAADLDRASATVDWLVKEVYAAAPGDGHESLGEKIALICLERAQLELIAVKPDETAALTAAVNRLLDICRENNIPVGPRLPVEGR
jgi:hypothetical protein